MYGPASSLGQLKKAGQLPHDDGMYLIVSFAGDRPESEGHMTMRSVFGVGDRTDLEPIRASKKE